MRVRNLTSEARRVASPARTVEPDEVLNVPDDGRIWPSSTWEVIEEPASAGSEDDE